MMPLTWCIATVAMPSVPVPLDRADDRIARGPDGERSLDMVKAFFPAVSVAVAAVVLSSCALAAPDEPAHYIRAGRFIGLVARCECSDLTGKQVLNEYPKVLASRYSPDQVEKMRGYIDSALSEHYANQMEICLEVCAQKCMVNTVAEPLGGKVNSGVAACPITERGLLLTIGRNRV